MNSKVNLGIICIQFLHGHCVTTMRSSLNCQFGFILFFRYLGLDSLPTKHTECISPSAMWNKVFSWEVQLSCCVCHSSPLPPPPFPHLHMHLPVYRCDVLQYSVCPTFTCTAHAKTTAHLEDPMLWIFYFGGTSLSLVGYLGHLTMVTHSIHKSSATNSCQCVQCFCVSKQWYGCQCLGFLNVCTDVDACDCTRMP